MKPCKRNKQQVHQSESASNPAAEGLSKVPGSLLPSLPTAHPEDLMKEQQLCRQVADHKSSQVVYQKQGASEHASWQQRHD